MLDIEFDELDENQPAHIERIRRKELAERGRTGHPRRRECVQVFAYHGPELGCGSR